MKAEIKLSIQPCFPHTTRLMVIIHIHLMISLAECGANRGGINFSASKLREANFDCHFVYKGPENSNP